ncbi:MAG: aminopeptidase P family protein [Pseudomonadota bacterium]
MFQTFDPVSDRSFAARNLPLLRASLNEQGLDGFIVPHDDEYQNEYIPAYAERLMWVSGFSGSAGSALVMLESAVIFVDGRYTLQVRDQVDDAFFEYISSETTPLDCWLGENAKSGQKIGYDPMLHSVNGLSRLKRAAKKAGAQLVSVVQNPIDTAWADQPAKPAAPIVPHHADLAGTSAPEKRKAIVRALANHGAESVLLTTPPSIAWAFNIRGGDVDRSPLPLSRALIHADGKADLFFDPAKGSNSLHDHLGPDVDVRAETDLPAVLAKLGAKGSSILIDPNSAPAGLADQLTQSGAKLVHGDDPCALSKAQKNHAELDGTRAAHIRDGVAVTRFLHWLATKAQNGTEDEISAAKMLETFRREDPTLKDLSFDTISGAGSNGAICHYRVSTETTLPLAPGTLYLVDSGGQYPDGTTDITRTVPIGTPTEEMRDRFTRVLKGHIMLGTARFPDGTTGHQLDALARLPLWQAGLDYDHGTGHGVGSYLGVHEGPQRIAKSPNAVALRPGMILSNEPGFYKAGEFGIRIENLVIVTKAQSIGDGERAMMGFETITLAPINRDLVITQLLNTAERDWLNAYHKRVRETLSPHLSEEVANWLIGQTEPL